MQLKYISCLSHRSVISGFFLCVDKLWFITWNYYQVGPAPRGSFLIPWGGLARCSTCPTKFCLSCPNRLVSWWRHQMETFSALLALCAGNSPVIGEFPTQRPVTRGFGVFFDLCLNKRLGNQSWGWWFETPSCSLWRHCNEVPKLPHEILTILPQPIVSISQASLSFGWFICKKIPTYIGAIPKSSGWSEMSNQNEEN